MSAAWVAARPQPTSRPARISHHTNVYTFEGLSGRPLILRAIAVKVTCHTTKRPKAKDIFSDSAGNLLVARSRRNKGKARSTLAAQPTIRSWRRSLRRPAGFGITCLGGSGSFSSVLTRISAFIFPGGPQRQFPGWPAHLRPRSQGNVGIARRDWPNGQGTSCPAPTAPASLRRNPTWRGAPAARHGTTYCPSWGRVSRRPGRYPSSGGTRPPDRSDSSPAGP